MYFLIIPSKCYVISLHDVFFNNSQRNDGLLFENRPAVYFSNYKENKKNNIRMLDTLFIEDIIESMEEYFHF